MTEPGPEAPKPQQADTAPSPSAAALDLAEVLRNEAATIDAIRKVREARKNPIDKGRERPAVAPGIVAPNSTDEKAQAWNQGIDAAHKANYTGLCFSGGGIRSATFNLGVLQALSELKLLHRFDYLSTVSGGGYIGGWLEAWILRRRSFADVQHRLGHSRVWQEETKEPTQIRFLRMFSNYLTPKIGAFSADTWAMISIYTRNMTLNLVILLALLAAALFVPHILLGTVDWLLPKLFWGPVALAVAFLAIQVATLHTNRNAAFVDGDWIDTCLWPTRPPQAFLLVGIPLMLLAVTGALWAWGDYSQFPWWRVSGSENKLACEKII